MKLAIAILLGTSLVACGKKSNSKTDSNTITAPFLAATDIAKGSGTQNAPTQTDMLSTLEGDSDFYNNQPQGSSSSTSSACDSVYSQLTISATATTATLGGTLDLTSCLQQDFSKSAGSGFTISVSKATVEVYMAATCTGGDLSSLNGTAIAGNSSSSQDASMFDKCTTSTMITNSKTDIASSTTISGQTQTGENVDVTYSGTAAMTPCTHTLSGQVITYDDSCVSTSRSDATQTPTSGAATTTEDYTNKTYAKVTDDANATAVWHSGGVINVTYDNWTGTVTYTSGATPPTYSLAPSGGAAVTGSFTQQSSSLQLRRATRRLQAQFEQQLHLAGAL